jgi:ABC-type lipoprotein export system ATPase subunit
MKPLIEIEGVTKCFDLGRIEVLRGVSMTAYEGEIVALCGSSGCGKSTLLNIISGLDVPDAGRVTVFGEKTSDEDVRVRLLRNHIGYVFQFHHLMPDLTLEENCMVPAVATSMKRSVAKIRLHDLAILTGMEHRLDRRVRELSGGERQRGALVRALMNDPSLLLCDEPTGALDEKNRDAVFSLLLDLVRLRKRTMIIATHDSEIAKRCDRVLYMRDGVIIGG